MAIEHVNTTDTKCSGTESAAHSGRLSGGQFGEQPAFEPVTLRRATAGDADALGVVGAATFLEAFTWALPGTDLIDFVLKNHTPTAYASYLAKPDTRITLAVTGRDVPVGYVMLCAPDLPTVDCHAGDIELKRIYLFSRFRAGGTSQRLMDAAIADAREMGRTRLLLGTHEGNGRAITFYRRNGFVEAGTRTFTVGAQVCRDLIFGLAL